MMCICFTYYLYCGNAIEFIVRLCVIRDSINLESTERERESEIVQDINTKSISMNIRMEIKSTFKNYGILMMQ